MYLVFLSILKNFYIYYYIILYYIILYYITAQLESGRMFKSFFFFHISLTGAALSIQLLRR